MGGGNPPITSDLRPDEFELTMPCGFADCKVMTTYAFSKEVEHMQRGLRKKLSERIKKDHIEGRHVKQH